MTLLSICVDTATEIGIPEPSSIVGNVDPNALKLLRYANKVGNSLMKKVEWQALRAEQTFTSLATETQTGILPDDFDRICRETFWNRSDRILISGPVSATRWQSLKATSYNDTSNPLFAYRGDNLLVQPTLAAGKTLAFEYVSRNWCESSGGTPQSAWADDEDVARLDEELIKYGLKFVYLNDEGLPTGSAGPDFVDYFNTLVKNDQPDAGVMVAGDIFGGGRHFTGSPVVDGDVALV